MTYASPTATNSRNPTYFGRSDFAPVITGRHTRTNGRSRRPNKRYKTVRSRGTRMRGFRYGAGHNSRPNKCGGAKYAKVMATFRDRTTRTSSATNKPTAGKRP